jgi:hypothetical protein
MTKINYLFHDNQLAVLILSKRALEEVVAVLLPKKSKIEKRVCSPSQG